MSVFGQIKALHDVDVKKSYFSIESMSGITDDRQKQPSVHHGHVGPMSINQQIIQLEKASEISHNGNNSKCKKINKRSIEYWGG